MRFVGVGGQFSCDLTFNFSNNKKQLEEVLCQPTGLYHIRSSYNLKIRIRSPEADGLDKAIKQEDDGGPPMLTPETAPHGLDVNGVPNGTNNGLCSMGGQAAGHLQLPGAGRVEDAPDGGRDDDQDSAFESNGRGDEDELDEDLDNDIQVEIY